jgi:hypothetical protein
MRRNAVDWTSIVKEAHGAARPRLETERAHPAQWRRSGSTARQARAHKALKTNEAAAFLNRTGQG